MSEFSSDDELWAKVTSTVRKTPSSRAHHLQKFATPLKKTSPLDKKKTPPSVIPVSPKLTPSQQKPVEIADLRQNHIAGIDRRSAKRMHAGKIAIDASLDLHGLTQAEAHQRLIRFVENAVHRGHRMLLVITGKGHAGQGVLRGKLPQWLKQPPLAPYINAIDHAVQRDGGTGAFYIKLRRHKEVR